MSPLSSRPPSSSSELTRLRSSPAQVQWTASNPSRDQRHALLPLFIRLHAAGAFARPVSSNNEDGNKNAQLGLLAPGSDGKGGGKAIAAGQSFRSNVYTARRCHLGRAT